MRKMITSQCYSLSALLSLSTESRLRSTLSGSSPITVPVNKLSLKLWNWGGIVFEQHNYDKYLFENGVTASFPEYAFGTSRFES